MPKSTALSFEEEAINVAFREHTATTARRLPEALQPAILHLSQSSRIFTSSVTGPLKPASGLRWQTCQKEVQTRPIHWPGSDAKHSREAIVPISILLKCEQSRVRFTCTSQSIEHQSSPLSSYTRMPQKRFPESSCSALSKPFLIETIPPSPTIASSSQHRVTCDKTVPLNKNAAAKRLHYYDHKEMRWHLSYFIAATILVEGSKPSRV